MDAGRDLQLIVDAMTEAAVLFAADGGIVFLNRAAEELTGWTAAYARGRPWRDVLSNVRLGDAPLPKLEDERARAKATRRLRARSGRFARIRVTKVIPPYEGAPGCVFLHRLDAHESSLEDNEARYQQLLELAQEGIWVIDAQASTTFVNPAMAAMLGYTRQEMQGRHLFEFMDDEARATAERNLARRRSGLRELHDFKLIRKDGSTVLTTMVAAPIPGPDGEYTGAIAGVIDISDRVREQDERRALEAKLHQAQRLEGLAVMAGGVAHDFNNLLQGILGYAELALAAVDAPQPRRFLEGIRKATHHGADLCDRMLVFAGRAAHEAEALDLSALVDELRPLLTASVPRTCELYYELAPRVPQIEADAVQLRQVLTNLVINAAEAIGETGTITIGVRARASGVELAVRDSGAGMTPDVRAKMFDPFFSTKFAGRGLGLAAVLGIAHAHKGDIDVETLPGAGTTIRITFPALQAAPPEPEEPLSAAPSTGARRILVVDDEEAVREALSGLLTEAGYHTTTAADGDECLSRYAEASFDAVLLDLTMPRRDGRHALEMLRSVDPEARVIVISGHSPEREADLAEHAAFLKKPFASEELLATVEALFD